MRLTHALIALAGCGEVHRPDEGGPDSCDTGETLAFEIYLTAYAREDDEGRVPGMNLDGRVSDVTDEEGCHQVDFVGPDGEEGVDNQFGSIAWELESDPYLIETGLIRTTLEGIADLDRDAEGNCQSVSAAFLAESRTD